MTAAPDVVGWVARAIAHAPGDVWERLPPRVRERWLDEAQLAIAAHKAALEAAGLVIVPREPTEAMQEDEAVEIAVSDCVRGLGGGWAGCIYRAMIAAAPVLS